MTCEVLKKINRKWMKMRLQPIRVYCLHHVCAEFDAESMNACDWMQIDDFKAKIQALRTEGIEFISLKEACAKMKNNKIRTGKYAVVTFDDGYASLKEVLPWLEEQKIPATLFINGKYLDGKSYRTNPKEQYLTNDELWALKSPLIEIGNHGWEHKRVTDIGEDEFEESVQRNVNLLSEHPNYMPFWAYTYGAHTERTDIYLEKKGLVPVFIAGEHNYYNKNGIDREFLE